MELENTFIRDFAELVTIIVSLAGGILAARHAMFFTTSKNELAIRVNRVFLTDSLLYLVTFVMGVGLFFNLALVVHYDVLIRPLVIMLNIVASVRLYEHYRKIGCKC